MCRHTHGFILLAILMLASAGSSRAGAPDAANQPGLIWSELSARAGGGKGAVQLASGDILATRMKRDTNGVHVVCARSTDGGRQWQDMSAIAREATRHADLGDGHLIQLPNGDVLHSYRHNRATTNATGQHHYSIRVAISHDAGASWQPHSVVAESTHALAREPEALRGLWSSFLLRKRDGTLQCYFDDEDTPHREGFFRNQWLTMKIWDTASRSWQRPVTVARATNPQHLSREGMPSVVELPDGRLLCVFESVQTAPPHANCLRAVTSTDGGQTWSWQHAERTMVFAARRENYLAVSPWMVRLSGGELLCVFATDEDRDTPSKPGTPPWAFRMDLKCVLSRDDGQTWSRPAHTIFAGNHRSYAPGVLGLRDGSLLVTGMSFNAAGHRAFRGVVE